MQSNSITDHIAAKEPPDEHKAPSLGKVNGLIGLDTGPYWREEENTIKQVLCSTLPDTTLNQIKGADNVKGAWEILKQVYEVRSKSIVADTIRRFQNKRCEEDASIRTHFETLANFASSLRIWGKHSMAVRKTKKKI